MSVKVITTKVKTGYSPRPLQNFLHNKVSRFSVICSHRRFGKTVFAINHLIHKAIKCKLEQPRFAYIARLYNQAKTIAWDYLKKYTQKIPGIKVNESELRIDFPNGARIRLFGADNPDSLRGQYFDGVVMDEYAQMRPRVWSEIIRPSLSDRKGWVLFIGTPKGKNAFYDLYDQAENGFIDEESGQRFKDAEWSAFTYKVSQTCLIDDDELSAARRIMTPEEYEQEYECSFQAAIIGSYYSKIIAELERQNRLVNVSIYEPKLPVHTAWDLGIGDSTAIWFFQIFRNEIRIIDYHENNGVGLESYVKVLNDRDYKYADHWLPHDAQIRELGTGRTRVETLIRMGINPKLIQKLSVIDGINAVRLTLPYCWFDAKKCGDGIEALRQYKREYDEKNKVFKEEPCHDWTSHAADAFRYLATAWRIQVPPKPVEKRPEGITINDLLKAKERRTDGYNRIL